jgi:hypothetical protein
VAFKPQHSICSVTAIQDGEIEPERKKDGDEKKGEQDKERGKQNEMQLHEKTSCQREKEEEKINHLDAVNWKMTESLTIRKNDT